MNIVNDVYASTEKKKKKKKEKNKTKILNSLDKLKGQLMNIVGDWKQKKKKKKSKNKHNFYIPMQL